MTRFDGISRRVILLSICSFALIAVNALSASAETSTATTKATDAVQGRDSP